MIDRAIVWSGYAATVGVCGWCILSGGKYERRLGAIILAAWWLSPVVKGDSLSYELWVTALDLIKFASVFYVGNRLRTAWGLAGSAVALLPVFAGFLAVFVPSGENEELAARVRDACRFGLLAALAWAMIDCRRTSSPPKTLNRTTDGS